MHFSIKLLISNFLLHVIAFRSSKLQLDRRKTPTFCSSSDPLRNSKSILFKSNCWISFQDLNQKLQTCAVKNCSKTDSGVKILPSETWWTKNGQKFQTIRFNLQTHSSLKLPASCGYPKVSHGKESVSKKSWRYTACVGNLMDWVCQKRGKTDFSRNSDLKFFLHICRLHFLH